MRRLLILTLFLGTLPGMTQESSSSQDKAIGRSAAVSDQTPVSPDVAKAEAALVKGDWKAAEPILDAWIAAHPDDARALFDAGYAADAQGRNDEAVGFYQKALAVDPKNFEATISLGLLLARTGKPTEGRADLETATTLDAGVAGPGAKAKAWRAMARIDLVGAEGKPDPTQASIDLLEALKLSPESEDDSLLAAQIAEASLDKSSAEAAYRRVLAKDPNSSVAHAGLAHVLIEQKKYPEAEGLLQSAVAKEPDNPALTAQLAAVLVAEDKADALPLLQKFHENHPQETVITRMLAQVLADAGEYADSDRLYVALLATEPHDSYLLSGHGQNLVRERQYPQALKAFEAATEADESNGEAWNGLAFSAFELKQPQITLHALTMRSKYLPESATIYFLWATAYDTLHDRKQAAAYYHQFLDASQGKLPDQEWQARQRLKLLETTP